MDDQSKHPAPTQTSLSKKSYLRRGSNIALFLFGFLLPVITLGVETVTHMCSDVLFDPIPTSWHIAVIALVPLSNLTVLLAVTRGKLQRLTILGLLNGLALGIAFIYTLVFIPFVPFAFYAIFIFGLGLLPLAPLFSLICAIALAYVLWQTASESSARPAIALGMVISFCLVFALEIPATITKMGMQKAASDVPEISRAGIRLLRAFGSEEILLNECYNQALSISDFLRLRLGIYDWTTRQKARSIYYRLTGRPFNSIAKAKRIAGRLGFFGGDSDDFDIGGEEVGGKATGVTLADSMLNGSLDPNAGLSYTEWTLVFKNNSNQQQEARTQIVLPPGGVVSRLTLWVKGKPQEAVFGSRSVTRGAYQTVVYQRRDPVLVTTLGPNRILLQCFPVPPSGKEMRVRLGITAPLTLLSKQETRLNLPRLLESNFFVSSQHALWFKSTQPLKSSLGSLKPEHREFPKEYSLHGTIAAPALDSLTTAIFANRSCNARQCWSEDPLSSSKQIVVEQLKEHRQQNPDLVVIVIDGSQAMAKFLPELSTALVKFPMHIKSCVLFASDEISQLSQASAGRPEVGTRLAAQELIQAPCVGGPDNVPVLLQALKIVSSTKNSAILWIHGSQPILSDYSYAIQSKFSLPSIHNKPHIYDLEVENGPNCLAAILSSCLPVSVMPRFGSLSKDLSDLFYQWSENTSTLKFVYTKMDPFTELATGLKKAPNIKTSLDLARLWAKEETERLIAKGQEEGAIKLASRYRLVTPVTGAVVLETAEQYKRAGLDPGNPDKNLMVPIVPEPDLWLLLFLTGTIILWQLGRSKFAAKSQA